MRDLQATINAVVVSAMGKSTDRLIEAARHAAEGNKEAADEAVEIISSIAVQAAMSALPESKD